MIINTTQNSYFNPVQDQHPLKSHFWTAIDRIREAGSFLFNAPFQRFGIDSLAVYLSPFTSQSTIPGSSNYEKVEGTNRPTYRLKADEQTRMQFDSTKLLPTSIQGSAFVQAGRDDEVCYHYAFENYRESCPGIFKDSSYPYYPISYLKNWESVSVENAQVGDRIFYSTETTPNPKVEHFGIISEIHRKVNAPPSLVILSKWGQNYIHRHNLDAIPTYYGNYFFLMRSRDPLQEENSSAAKFNRRYQKCIKPFALTLLPLCGLFLYYFAPYYYELTCRSSNLNDWDEL